LAVHLIELLRNTLSQSDRERVSNLLTWNEEA
jgi:hypothetical protein